MRWKRWHVSLQLDAATAQNFQCGQPPDTHTQGALKYVAGGQCAGIAMRLAGLAVSRRPRCMQPMPQKLWVSLIFLIFPIALNACFECGGNDGTFGAPMPTMEAPAAGCCERSQRIVSWCWLRIVGVEAAGHAHRNVTTSLAAYVDGGQCAGIAMNVWPTIGCLDDLDACSRCRSEIMDAPSSAMIFCCSEFSVWVGQPPDTHTQGALKYVAGGQCAGIAMRLAGLAVSRRPRCMQPMPRKLWVSCFFHPPDTQSLDAATACLQCGQLPDSNAH